MPPAANSEQAWLERARTLVLHGDHTGAETAVSLALQKYPRSFELRRILAGIYSLTRREREAETLLARLFTERREDAATAFTLARLLISRCRSAAAAAVMRDHFEHGRYDPELAIKAVELLDDCGRKHDAAVIAEHAIAAAPGDPRLHAYAGMLEMQLGDFERARAHYLYALECAPQACEWHVPLGLASMQRYRDATHPDFTRFRDCLRRGDLGDRARSTVLFALAKAHDDIGDFAHAAGYSRTANALARSLTRWSHRDWQDEVEELLKADPTRQRLEPPLDFVPVFIVGMPRSGTTLVAELLARYPQMCNRGESPWMATLARQIISTGYPDRSTLQRAAGTYAEQMRQDDPQAARWFIDKQPLNFRYVDLMLALFPNARIVHCRRDARDNALSLWMQSFLEDVQGYAYDFSDIAMAMRDCERLMAHWHDAHPDSIRTVRYEQLVTAPQAVMAGLVVWLGLPAADPNPTPVASPTSIGTASLWQARQPVYASSVGRWKNYATHLPELLRFREDEPVGDFDQRPPGGNSM